MDKNAWIGRAQDNALADLGQAIQDKADAEARIASMSGILDALAAAAAAGIGADPQAQGPDDSTPQQPEYGGGLVRPGGGRITRADRVRALLEASPGRLFKVREIDDALAIGNVKSLRNTLQTMVERGQIDRGSSARYRARQEASSTLVPPDAGELVQRGDQQRGAMPVRKGQDPAEREAVPVHRGESLHALPPAADGAAAYVLAAGCLGDAAVDGDSPQQQADHAAAGVQGGLLQLREDSELDLLIAPVADSGGAAGTAGDHGVQTAEPADLEQFLENAAAGDPVGRWQPSGRAGS